MRHIRGGLEYRSGDVVPIQPPPSQMASPALKLRIRQRPEVHVGQLVTQGQMLSRPEDRRLACHISPIHGRIEGLIERPDKGYDLLIEPMSETAPTQLEVKAPPAKKIEAWIKQLRHLGPWGMGDGYVGLIVQLEAALLMSPKELICVAADSFAPYPIQSSLATSFGQEMAEGTRLLANLLGLAQPTILTGPGRASFREIRRHAASRSIRVRQAEGKYPVANWSLVSRYQTQTRRLIQRGANPLEAGVVLINGWTAIRLARWFASDKVDMVRPLGLAWPEADAKMQVHWVMPGQRVFDLHPRLAAEQRSPYTKLIFGDPLRGRLEATLDDQGRLLDPVAPDNEFLLSLVEHPLPEPQLPCIACGWCSEVCPTSLQPVQLYRQCQSHPDDVRLYESLAWCIDCGLCSHVCPSAIPLAQTFRESVSHLLELSLQS